MRIMAQVSGDVALRQLFTSSGDVYVLLASSIFSKDCSLINPQERNQAKVICLGGYIVFYNILFFVKCVM